MSTDNTVSHALLKKPRGKSAICSYCGCGAGDGFRINLVSGLVCLDCADVAEEGLLSSIDAIEVDGVTLYPGGHYTYRDGSRVVFPLDGVPYFDLAPSKSRKVPDEPYYIAQSKRGRWR